jgi:glycosyltransferase involved in cell wall biosynthesis
MRVAFIAQPFDSLRPPVEGGSLAIWIYQVARICALRGHEPVVFANHGQLISAESISRDGVQYVFTPTGLNRVASRIARAWCAVAARFNPSRTSPPEFGAAWSDAGYALEAARRARDLGCEVVHIMNYSQFVPIVRRVHPKARIYLHMECEWLTQLPRADVEKRIQAVDFVVGCSEYITEKVAERFPQFADRCITVPNAAPTTGPYDRSETEPGYVLFVGRVSPEKGVHVLVRAFHTVLRRHPDARLHIAGGIGSAPIEYLIGLSDDPKVIDLRAFYERRAGQVGDPYGHSLTDEAGEELGKRIFLDGRVNNSEISGYYRRAAVLVNPSLSEAFGMSLVEAMMYRVPVVASRVGGMTNIVLDGRTGLLVEPADPDALAEAISALLDDRERASEMGDAGRARAIEKYSWDTTTDLLLEYFRGKRA